MVKTVDELITEVTEKFGGDKSDAFIEFLENMTDTFSDLSSKIADVDARIATLDNEWRDKYIKRFTTPEPSGSENDKEEETETEKETEKTIDDLFD